jgi:hypothetical protein
VAGGAGNAVKATFRNYKFLKVAFTNFERVPGLVKG